MICDKQSVDIDSNVKSVFTKHLTSPNDVNAVEMEKGDFVVNEKLLHSHKANARSISNVSFFGRIFGARQDLKEPEDIELQEIGNQCEDRSVPGAEILNERGKVGEGVDLMVQHHLTIDKTPPPAPPKKSGRCGRKRRRNNRSASNNNGPILDGNRFWLGLGGKRIVFFAFILLCLSFLALFVGFKTLNFFERQTNLTLSVNESFPQNQSNHLKSNDLTDYKSTNFFGENPQSYQNKSLLQIDLTQDKTKAKSRKLRDGFLQAPTVAEKQILAKAAIRFLLIAKAASLPHINFFNPKNLNDFKDSLKEAFFRIVNQKSLGKFSSTDTDTYFDEQLVKFDFEMESSVKHLFMGTANGFFDKRIGLKRMLLLTKGEFGAYEKSEQDLNAMLIANGINIEEKSVDLFAFNNLIIDLKADIVTPTQINGALNKLQTHMKPFIENMIYKETGSTFERKTPGDYSLDAVVITASQLAAISDLIINPCNSKNGDLISVKKEEENRPGICAKLILVYKLLLTERSPFSHVSQDIANSRLKEVFYKLFQESFDKQQGGKQKAEEYFSKARISVGFTASVALKRLFIAFGNDIIYKTQHEIISAIKSVYPSITISDNAFKRLMISAGINLSSKQLNFYDEIDVILGFDSSANTNNLIRFLDQHGRQEVSEYIKKSAFTINNDRSYTLKVFKEMEIISTALHLSAFASYYFPQNNKRSIKSTSEDCPTETKKQLLNIPTTTTTELPVFDDSSEIEDLSEENSSEENSSERHSDSDGEEEEDDEFFIPVDDIVTNTDYIVFDEIETTVPSGPSRGNALFKDGTTEAHFEAIREKCLVELQKIIDNENNKQINYTQLIKRLENYKTTKGAERTAENTWMQSQVFNSEHLASPYYMIMVHNCQPRSVKQKSTASNSVKWRNDHLKDTLIAAYRERIAYNKNYILNYGDPKVAHEDQIEFDRNSIITEDLIKMCELRMKALKAKDKDLVDRKKILETIDSHETIDQLKQYVIFQQLKGNYVIEVFGCTSFSGRDGDNALEWRRTKTAIKNSIEILNKVKVDKKKPIPLETNSKVTITLPFYRRDAFIVSKCEEAREKLGQLSEEDFKKMYENIRTEDWEQVKSKYFLLDINYIHDPTVRIEIFSCRPLTFFVLSKDKKTLLDRLGSYYTEHGIRRSLELRFKKLGGIDKSPDEDLTLSCKDWQITDFIFTKINKKRDALISQNPQALQLTDESNVNFNFVESFIENSNRQEHDRKKFFLLDHSNPQNKNCRWSILDYTAYSVYDSRRSLFKTPQIREIMESIIKRGKHSMLKNKIISLIDRLPEKTVEKMISIHKSVINEVFGQGSLEEIVKALDIKTTDENKLNQLDLFFFNDRYFANKALYKTNIICIDPRQVMQNLNDKNVNKKTAIRVLKTCVERREKENRFAYYEEFENRFDITVSRKTFCRQRLDLHLAKIGNAYGKQFRDANGNLKYDDLINFINEHPSNYEVIIPFYSITQINDKTGNFNTRLRLFDCSPINIFQKDNVYDIQNAKNALISRLVKDSSDYNAVKNKGVETIEIDVLYKGWEKDGTTYLDYNTIFYRGNIFKERSRAYNDLINSLDQPHLNELNSFNNICAKESLKVKIVYALVSGSCWDVTSPNRIKNLNDCIYYLGKGYEVRPKSEFSIAFNTLPSERTPRDNKIVANFDGKPDAFDYIVILGEYDNDQCALSAEASAIVSFGLEKLTNQVQGHFKYRHLEWKFSNYLALGAQTLMSPKSYIKVSRGKTFNFGPKINFV